MTSDELRKKFLDFFAGCEHKVLPGAPLIPSDPTALFTSAGMQQFVPMFRGEVPPSSPRIATCQKCFRADDLDSVGHTARHHTFFEMLGNFSFGDYFKREAIAWAWEFSTQWLGLPQDRLWVSVHLDDDESFEIWRRDIGIPQERIIRLGKEDNWWGPVGPTGPCGPCTELYLDLGEKRGCGKPDCRPGCDCDRFNEFWNLVFQMYDLDESGNLNPLPKTGVDTGLGLERTASLVQGVVSNFEIDIFRPIIDYIGQIAEEAAPGFQYQPESKDKAAIAVRIIADHIRAISFLIADGVMPSNEWRGYVLRRVIRRAYRFGRLLSITQPFLHRMVPVVTRVMKVGYPELEEKQDLVIKMVRAEEERFQSTLEQGTQLLDRAVAEIREKGNKTIPGQVVFELYDTYGFPKELTAEIASDRGLTIDESGYAQAMEEQRARARAGVEETFAYEDTAGYARFQGHSEFVGHETTQANARIVGMVKESKAVEQAEQGDQVEVILDVTPFYAEMGGQVGDTGILSGVDDSGQPVRALVSDTQWATEGVIVHRAQVEQGKLQVGQSVQAEVDAARRQAITRAHTTAHLLHHALREVLGRHATQSGTFKEPDRLRFDFSHFAALTPDQLSRINQMMTENILAGHPVRHYITSFQAAKEEGAIALFDEKYGETVRVLQVGDFSKELCGGTHVENTSLIGSCLLLSESSIGAGLRRVEVATGLEAARVVQEQEEVLREIGDLIHSSRGELPQRVKQLLTDLKQAEKRIESLQGKRAALLVDELVGQAQPADGFQVVAARVPDLGGDALRDLADSLINKLGSGVVVLGTVVDKKVFLVSKISQDLVSRGLHAGNLIREVAKATGGGGGGRPDFAQAGGRDASKLDEALTKVPELVSTQQG